MVAFGSLAVSAQPAIDWNRMGDEVAELLRAYVRVNTANPPGITMSVSTRSMACDV